MIRRIYLSENLNIYQATKKSGETIAIPENNSVDLAEWINKGIEDGTILVPSSTFEPTDLAFTSDITQGYLTSSTGQDTIITAATTLKAGLMTAQDKTALLGSAANPNNAWRLDGNPSANALFGSTDSPITFMTNSVNTMKLQNGILHLNNAGAFETSLGSNIIKIGNQLATTSSTSNNLIIGNNSSVGNNNTKNIFLVSNLTNSTSNTNTLLSTNDSDNITNNSSSLLIGNNLSTVINNSNTVLLGNNNSISNTSNIQLFGRNNTIASVSDLFIVSNNNTKAFQVNKGNGEIRFSNQAGNIGDVLYSSGSNLPPVWGSSIKKYTATTNIIAGLNTITHNLNISDPKAFFITILDANNNTVNISNYTTFTNNSFSWISSISLLNVHITIIG